MDPKKLRIVFMGTPDFATGVLQALLENKYQVVAVITAVDKPAGRGKKLRMSSVKEYAISKDIPVLQPPNLKNPDFLDKLDSYKADLQVIVAFRMLPKAVWDMPTYGTINLHASLLPAYRGAAPINWAIINGETETGVTTFFIDDKIDTGAVLLQEKTNISQTETAGSLHDKLLFIGARLVQKTIDLIATENYKAMPQPAIPSSLAPKLYKETCKIDWNQPVVKIYNMIRGLNPYPAAWTILQSNGYDYPLKIFMSHVEYEKPAVAFGSIIRTKKTLKVAGLDGYLFIDELQVSGKRKMDIVSFLNGFQLTANAQML